MSEAILLATVVGPHGLKGEARLKVYTASAKTLGAYGPLRMRDGRAVVVAAIREGRAGEAIATFEGIDARDDVEAIRGQDLFVARDALPEPAANEFYHVDLIGLRAEDAEGRTIGRVHAVHNYGAGDVIEIIRADGDSVLLAFTAENVPLIEPKAGRVVIAVPEEVEAQTRGTVE